MTTHDSQPDHGTHPFPFRPAASDRSCVTDAPRLAARRKMRVLVVDDYHDGADSLAMLVSSWGHDARGTYGGVIGLKLAREFLPDVVFTDIAMPEMDGCDLAAELRTDPALAACFLIAVTGLTGERHRDRCHAAGFDLYFQKPANAVMLRMLLTLECQRLGCTQFATLDLAQAESSGCARPANPGTTVTSLNITSPLL